MVKSCGNDVMKNASSLFYLYARGQPLILEQLDFLLSETPKLPNIHFLTHIHAYTHIAGTQSLTYPTLTYLQPHLLKIPNSHFFHISVCSSVSPFIWLSLNYYGLAFYNPNSAPWKNLSIFKDTIQRPFIMRLYVVF